MLMEKVAAGDQDALMAVYDRYSELVYTLCFHVLRNPQAAEDIMQDVFLQLSRKASLYNPARGNLMAWLTVMARHQAIDNLRRKKRDLRLADAVIMIDRSYPNLLDSSPDVVMVRSILEKLPAEQQEVVNLAYFAGLTHTEIASQTRKPLGTVKSRIRSALQSLKQLFDVDANPRRENSGVG